MKKSELRKIIKEELLKEAKSDWMATYKGTEIWVKNIFDKDKALSGSVLDSAGQFIYNQIGKTLDAAQKKYKINFSKVVIDTK